MENITLSRRAVFAIGAVFAVLLLLVAYLVGRAPLGRSVAATTQTVAATATPSSTLTGTWLSISGTAGTTITVGWLDINAGTPASGNGTVIYALNGKQWCQSHDLRTYPADVTDSRGTYTFTCGGAEMGGTYTSTSVTLNYIPPIGYDDQYNRSTPSEYQIALQSCGCATPTP
jgi:hypothetical protein